MTRFLIVFATLTIACTPSNANNNNANNDDGGENNASDAGNNGSDLPAGELLSPINVLTWNVEQYFDTVCDSGRCGNGDFEQQLSGSEFEFRASQIADAIRGEEPDIILFQEIEKEICVAQIGEELGMEGVAFGETFFNASLDVGVLTRGDVNAIVTPRDDTALELPLGGTDSFTREFLEVHIEIDGRDVIVFNAHFKSKFNDNPDLREAEAAAAREIVVGVVEENPDALVILGGDLNDTPDSVPLENLTEGDDLTLVSSDETWTYVFANQEQAIDHLLFSDSDTVDVVPDSVRAVRDGSGFGLSISDHAALTATFGFVE